MFLQEFKSISKVREKIRSENKHIKKINRRKGWHYFLCLLYVRIFSLFLGRVNCILSAYLLSCFTWFQEKIEENHPIFLSFYTSCFFPSVLQNVRFFYFLFLPQIKVMIYPSFLYKNETKILLISARIIYTTI